MQRKSNTAEKYRQRYLEYAETHNVSETSRRYRVSRKTLYKWRKRWDGTKESLSDQSRRPKTSPMKHTEQEERQIRKRLKQCRRTDLILAYQLLIERDGYTRSYGSFKHIAAKLKGQKPKRKKKKKAKSYERAAYPGQKVQIDVKYVPKECAADGRKYYQFTAVDECSRWAFREMYSEHNSYSAKDFLIKLIRRSPFPIRMVQTDNGPEFTNALFVVKAKHKTLFEAALMDMGIE